MNNSYMFKQKNKNIDQDFIFSFDYIQLEDKKREQKEQKEPKEPKEQNELKVNAFNEISISEKIKMIYGWQKYTTPILYSSIVSGLNKYIVVKEKMNISLYYFLQDKREKNIEQIEKKETIVQIIGIYNSLLKILEWTGELNGFVSLSCNLNDIFLNKNGKVKLVNFSHSFFTNDIQLSLFISPDIIANDVHLNIHVLHYLSQSSNISLSSNNVYEICAKFISKLKQTHLFSLEFLKTGYRGSRP